MPGRCSSSRWRKSRADVAAGTDGAVDLGALSPGALALFRARVAELSRALTTLPDKPEETAEGTLAALWHAAAGQPLSVRRATGTALPELDAAGIARLIGLLALRIAGTPLAHLTGRQQFMGVEMLASAEALIPRAETELLGRTALALLQGILEERGEATVVDVCTGSGNLALALASHEPRARVRGADLSDDAVALARRNAAHLGLSGRVEFRCGDLLAPFESADFLDRVDLLVCNPPYISSGKVAGMAPEIIGHEPRLAFDGGPLGIRILQRLITQGPRYLRAGGWLAFEVGLGQGNGIRQRLEKQGGYAEIRTACDANGEVRVLAGRARGAHAASRR